MKPRLAGLLVATAMAGAAMSAQSNQPIYPAYDGFIRNADGSFTLAFGYFSHNGDAVTVAVGPSNRFTPQPDDRGQPTTFLPGHHRFQCVVIVEPGFEGTLRWSVAFAGKTTASSEKMLQYSWELEDASVREVMRGVDLKTAPRGVCLNRPPVVRILGLAAGRGGRTLSVTMPDEVRLFGSVEDEGLPRHARLTIAWKKISGPGTVTFTNPDAARTRASFSEPGTYQLELYASDSERDGRIQVTVAVRR